MKINISIFLATYLHINKADILVILTGKKKKKMYLINPDAAYQFSRKNTTRTQYNQWAATLKFIFTVA